MLEEMLGDGRYGFVYSVSNMRDGQGQTYNSPLVVKLVNVPPCEVLSKTEVENDYKIGHKVAEVFSGTALAYHGHARVTSIKMDTGIMQIDTTDPPIALLMEKGDGMTLVRFIEDSATTPTQILTAFENVAKNLYVLQAKLKFVHFDLHAGNILVNSEGSSIQLIDFANSITEPNSPGGVFNPTFDLLLLFLQCAPPRTSLYEKVPQLVPFFKELLSQLRAWIKTHYPRRTAYIEYLPESMDADWSITMIQQTPLNMPLATFISRVASRHRLRGVRNALPAVCAKRMQVLLEGEDDMSNQPPKKPRRT
jgi:serine/threonine protein kinase